ncbi:MAG TPA: hypothetical protein VJ570_08530 [Holophagaceae bacterium]|nr:hypothetical protein [Holophagaceae bacterium]
MTPDASDFNPYQAPTTPDLIPPPPPEEVGLPLPWEDRERYPAFWKRVGEMFSLVFNDPLGFFERVPRGTGLSRPWLFQLLLMAPLLLILMLVFGILGLAGGLAALGAPAKEGPPAWLFPLLLPALLILMPAFLFLGMIVGGALSHFFLWLWGGLRAGESMEHTIRAQGYAGAFISLGGMIPYLGILVQLAGFVWMGMGLARMHRTDTWRGICALLTPIFLCCCVGLLAAIMIPALVAARH